MIDEIIIPIFPLDLIVLPGEPVPLHIFEPRYKQLLTDCAPTIGSKHYQPFGMVYSKSTKLNEIGCTVVVDEILHKYPQGELDIMSFGSKRFRLLESYRDKVYLTGLIEWVEDQEESVSVQQRQQVLDLYEKFLTLVDVEDHTIDRKKEKLSFEIAYRIHPEKPYKLELLEALSESERLRILQKYLEESIPQIEQAKEFKRVVRSNGYFA